MAFGSIEYIDKHQLLSFINTFIHLFIEQEFIKCPIWARECTLCWIYIKLPSDNACTQEAFIPMEGTSNKYNK